MKFTDMFLEYTCELESPESFFRWSSYSAISAVLRDNVYIDLGAKRVWPNVYTILMARSAALRKSVPVQIAADLIEQVGNTKIIKGRSSIQAVIRDLGQTETSRNGTVSTSASGIIVSEELASFSPEDPATIPLLTDLYDNHKNWANRMVASGSAATLKNTCVNLLAATNEPFFKEVYTMLAMRGGLLGRTFIVREEKKRLSNSLMYLDYPDIEDLKKHLAEKYNPTLLVQKLKSIARVKGVIMMDYDARVEFDKWYKIIEKARIGDTGVTERMHFGALKVALLLAMGESEELCIRKYQVEEAIDRCVLLLRNYEVITMAAGKSESAEPSAIFLAYLWEKGGESTHQEVVRDNWMHFDLKALEGIVQTLVTGELVRETIANGKAGYQLTARGKKVFDK